MSSLLQFSPLASSLHPEFWQALTRLKIDSLKLSEEAIDVVGRYSAGRTVLDRETGQSLSLGASVHYDGDAFDISGSDDSAAVPPSSDGSSCQLRGRLLNYNTIESFKQSDKQSLFRAHADKLWALITDEKQPITAADLNISLAITFADLKKYSFFYWFAFPAFAAKPAWQLQTPWATLVDAYTSDQIKDLSTLYREHTSTHGSGEAPACLLRCIGGDGRYESAPLSHWTTFFANVPEDERTLLFLDPSSDGTAAGWPLRNFLAYLNTRHQASRLRVICYRSSPSESLTTIVTLDSPSHAYDRTTPTAVGWEKNTAGKLGPRMANLGGLMDPKRLADQAVDLNLKLMRWRILPALDLDKIKETKCLLLGAGTLGCYVSRSLMAWGVRKITLVDSGKVSYSNPVRQPLFEFMDCFEGGKPKAACAAEALKRIYPSVDAEGIQLAIPMPGHPIPSSSLDATKVAVSKLGSLMDEHDVTFLLMDSRESRWLPTLLGAAKGKLVVNAALGFDSYLVMRHGMLGQSIDERLGCYYCNDIVAPMDSLSDRTLDQMCTVTRPGLAAIASATAVEVLTSVIQHPKGAHAPSSVDRSSGSVLGAVPHQIRGSLSDFSQLKITGRAYSSCTACSEKVVDVYRKDGFDMLRKAFDDAKYLEQITGLDKLQAETEAALEAVDFDDEEDNF